MVYKLTKLNTAINRILKNIQPLNKKTKILLDEANQKINYNTLKSNLSLPETLNSAVDGYGISYESFLKNPKTKFHVVALAKAGNPYPKKIMELYAHYLQCNQIDTPLAELFFFVKLNSTTLTTLSFLLKSGKQHKKI